MFRLRFAIYGATFSLANAPKLEERRWFALGSCVYCLARASPFYIRYAFYLRHDALVRRLYWANMNTDWNGSTTRKEELRLHCATKATQNACP
jgi:hypothetical protein